MSKRRPTPTPALERLTTIEWALREAASEILSELLQPDLDDLARRAALGLHDAASQIGLGLLRGLAGCRTAVEDGTVLAYAGRDVTDDWPGRSSMRSPKQR